MRMTPRRLSVSSDRAASHPLTNTLRCLCSCLITFTLYFEHIDCLPPSEQLLLRANSVSYCACSDLRTYLRQPFARPSLASGPYQISTRPRAPPRFLRRSTAVLQSAGFCLKETEGDSTITTSIERLEEIARQPKSSFRARGTGALPAAPTAMPRPLRQHSR
jgi:hypothetical protein